MTYSEVMLTGIFAALCIIGVILMTRKGGGN